MTLLVPQTASAVDYATVVKYAPELRFSSYENLWPQNPNVYLTQVSLRFSRNNNTDPVISDGIGTDRFGASATSPYTYTHNGKTFNSKQFTRPYGGGSVPRESGLADNEGFFLQQDSTSVRSGRVPTDTTNTFTGVRMHYQFSKQSDTMTAITYWVFYSYNHPKPAGSSTYWDHQGDWERIKVIVRNSDYTPVSVWYYSHECSFGTTYATTTPKNGTHPVVWVGAGSHASYPYVQDGRPDRCDAAPVGDDYVDNNGRRWQVWTNTNYLVDLKAQWYYGFGGAWGVVGTYAGSTGPLGPSDYKSLA